jgi:G3E family GTPase
VAQTFFATEKVMKETSLDAIVTLVDARHADLSHEAVNQVVIADRIIMNKVDLVDDARLGELEAEVRRLNATAPILRSSHARVDLENILGIGAFHAQRGEISLEHEHAPGMESRSFVFDQPFDAARLERWLKALLDAHEIYRVKGILALKDEPRRHVLQAVRRMMEIRAADAWGGERPQSKLVFIGLDLDRAALEAGLSGCLA